MSGNEMGDYGARLLAKALQVNTSLTSVRLDRNRIGAQGFADLAHALSQSSPLPSHAFPD